MDELNELIFPYLARVRRVDTQERQTELLALAKERGALDSAIFDERPPFFWTAEISNSLLDFYYTHMLESSLQNFANDARAGVSFLNSHRYYELPFGRSLDGRVELAENRKRTLADFFTLPGLTLNGVSTDDFITGVRSGILKDTSIGFSGGKWFCDVCRMNYLSYTDCSHFAGQTYETQDGPVLCTVSIDGARLNEVSVVYDGATPDATILKAQRMAEAGELELKTAQALEARYRVKLPAKRSFAGARTKETKTMNYEEVVNQVREALSLAEDGDVAATVGALVAEVEALRATKKELDATVKRATEAEKRAGEIEAGAKELEVKVNDLTPFAADGRQYRDDLISESLAEGVRAYGEKFDAETYEGILRSATLTVIKRMKADWQVIGDSRFAGGRQTKDEGDAPGERAPARERIPAGAYKA